MNIKSRGDLPPKIRKSSSKTQALRRDGTIISGGVWATKNKRSVDKNLRGKITSGGESGILRNSSVHDHLQICGIFHCMELENWTRVSTKKIAELTHLPMFSSLYIFYFLYRHTQYRKGPEENTCRNFPRADVSGEQALKNNCKFMVCGAQPQPNPDLANKLTHT